MANLSPRGTNKVVFVSSKRWLSTSPAVYRREKPLAAGAPSKQKKTLSGVEIQQNITRLKRATPKAKELLDNLLKTHEKLDNKQEADTRKFNDTLVRVLADQPRPESYGLSSRLPKPDEWERNYIKPPEPLNKIVFKEKLNPAQIREKFQKMYGPQGK